MSRGALSSSLLAGPIWLLALAQPASAPDRYDAIREAFLAKINATRRESALPSLRLSPALSRIAQQRAERLAAGGDEESETAESVDALSAAKSGYEARFLAEVTTQADGDVEMVYAEASQKGGPLAEQAGRAELRDLGLGVAVEDEVPLYVFLFGVSWEDFAAAKRTELSDLSRVRREIQESVNRERTSRGLAPLRRERLLDDTAQRHAEDMLARSYYGHESPEGSTVLDRAKLAGYRPRFIGENVAQGQSSVDEVMAGWMGSEVHREHILSPLFIEVGSGVAVGKNANGYQILWVQCFGRPKDAIPPRRRTGPPKGPD